jgi:hypothetical protein
MVLTQSFFSSLIERAIRTKGFNETEFELPGVEGIGHGSSASTKRCLHWCPEPACRSPELPALLSS